MHLCWLAHVDLTQVNGGPQYGVPQYGVPQYGVLQAAHEIESASIATQQHMAEAEYYETDQNERLSASAHISNFEHLPQPAANNTRPRAHTVDAVTVDRELFNTALGQRCRCSAQQAICSVELCGW